MTKPLDLSAIEALMMRRTQDDPNRVHEWLEKIERAYERVERKNDEPVSAIEALLRPALTAAGWTGQERHIQEVMPHFEHLESLEQLRGVLARLGVTSSGVSIASNQISVTHIPCLFQAAGAEPILVMGLGENGTLTTFNGHEPRVETINVAGQTGTAYILRLEDIREQNRLANKAGWVASLLAPFKPLIITTFLVSLMINLAALALPFFIMHIYDLGIATKSNEVVLTLAIGAALVILFDLAIRHVRDRAMAYFGARFDSLLSVSAFQHLLHLPIQMTESAPIGSQIARLRQFEGMRDVFSGTLAVAIVDVPFMFMFLIAIAAVGGHLVWIPIALIAVFLVTGAATLPITRRHTSQTGEARQRCQDLVIEMLTKRTAIRDIGAEDIFLSRHDTLSRRFAALNYQAQQFNNRVQVLAQTLVTIAGVATLGLGTIWTLNGSMSQGALIAVMALVWRVLSPLQSTFLSLPRLETAQQTIQQINRLMAIKAEREPGVLPSFTRDYRGGITVARATFRYATRAEPTLKGISLAVKPGEMIALTGASGSGKSTLLKIIAGLYSPQGGAVFADGLDIRQFDPAEWRASIGYVPENATFFYGTIAQNLKLGCPNASASSVETAAREAGLELDQDLLPEGLQTRLNTALLTRLPEALRQRLMLARAYVRETSLYLLDNPANNLDNAGDTLLQSKLRALKGNATVLFTSQRPSHMLLADRLVVLSDGIIVMDGPPQQVLAKLSEAA